MSSYSLLQAQLLTFATLLQCDRKEYQEDWRKTPVVRDGGRFASSNPSDDAASKSSGIREGINRATQSAVRGMVGQITKQIQKLPEEQQRGIMEMLDEPGAIAIRKSIRKLVDPEGQAAFDKVADKMRGRGAEATLVDHIKAGGRVGEKVIEATVTSPIAVAKGVLGGIAWPLLTLHGLRQINDPELAVQKAAGEAISVLGGAAMLASAVDEIVDKAGERMEKEDRQKLSEELNQFFLGVKKLEA